MIGSHSSCQECRRRKIRCTYTSSDCLVCSGCQIRNRPCLKVIRKPKARCTSITGATELHDEESRSSMVRSTIVESDQLYEALLSVWPTKDLLEQILGLPVSLYGLLYSLSYRPSLSLESSFSDMIANFLRAPFQASRLLLAAKKLLTLVSYIQALPDDSVRVLQEHGYCSLALTSRLIKLVHQIVASDDSMISPSLETIECDLMEAMFYNNTGDFRRAWLVNRRALASAQMLRFHTTPSSNDIAATYTHWPISPHPAYMWLRIICNDRYLSLVLSLPAGYNGSECLAMDISVKLNPLDHMERLECTAGGLILEHLQGSSTDLTILGKVNDILTQAANCMPVTWWSAAPNNALLAADNREGVLEISRLMLQITHYHLLIQLHLPQMLGYFSLEDQGIYNSILVACNAARAMLIIYIIFKQHIKSSAHCRGIDVVALVASTALAIGHLIARDHPNDTNKPEIAHSLSSQRLHDRELLDSTLKIMLCMARREHDTTAERITSFLRPLLAVEEASWNGERYKASRYLSTSNGKTSHRTGLKIELPHIGIVHIVKQDDYVNRENACHSEIALGWPLSEKDLFDAFVNDADLDFVLLEIDACDGAGGE